MSVKKRLFKILLVILCILVTLVRCISIVSRYFNRTSRLERVFSTLTDRVIVTTYQLDTITVRYADLGSKSAPPVILLHGAPGNITTWMQFLKNTDILQTHRVIIPDRPGYGQSMGRKKEATIDRQSQLLLPLLSLPDYTESPILIGHSLGGPIVTRMSADAPDRVKGMVHVASAADPHSQIIRLATYPLVLPPLRWISTPELTMTNDEKIITRRELSALEPVRSTISIPTIILHGPTDWIVPVDSAYFMQERLIHAPLASRIKDEYTHLIPFDNPTLITDAISEIEVMGKQ